jgi:phosphopantetheinyl transferase (holo-ACP synthase)
MDTEKFMDLIKTLDKKKKGKQEELEKIQKYFDRFHLINRHYLNKETYEKALGSLSSIAETMVNTIQYLDVEIARLRNKRMKLPFENVELAEMQKTQGRNELLLKEYLAESPK